MGSQRVRHNFLAKGQHKVETSALFLSFQYLARCHLLSRHWKMCLHPECMDRYNTHKSILTNHPNSQIKSAYMIHIRVEAHGSLCINASLLLPPPTPPPPQSWFESIKQLRDKEPNFIFPSHSRCDLGQVTCFLIWIMKRMAWMVFEPPFCPKFP